MYQAPLVVLVPMKGSVPLCVSPSGQTDNYVEFEVPIE